MGLQGPKRTCTGSWTQLDNFPGGARGFAYGVNEGNDAYLGFGSNAVGYPTDWWHLDMTTGTWTELASFPGEGRNHPALVWVNNQVVMALGSNADGNQGDLWLHGQTGRYTLAIRDLNGRLLLTEENQLNGKQHVDISGLPAGVYTVGILTQGQWHRAPLVVR